MAGPSVSELRAALRRVLPGLDGESIVLHLKDGQVDPRWHSGSAVTGGALIAKFAWSQVAAVRTHREGEMLRALRSTAPHLPLPEVVATSADPVLLVSGGFTRKKLVKILPTPFVCAGRRADGRL